MIRPLINSLVFGSEGSYNILAIPVTFQKEHKTSSSKQPKYFNIFFTITQGYVHVFVHEMSHAIMARLFGLHSRVVMLVDFCSGETAFGSTGPWKDVIILTSGCMGNIAFSTCKLALAIILKKYIAFPIYLVLNTGSLTWIITDLVYTFIMPVLQKNQGDYGQIARLGNGYLAVASIALISECTLAAFLLTKLHASYN